MKNRLKKVIDHHFIVQLKIDTDLHTQKITQEEWDLLTKENKSHLLRVILGVKKL